jgi:hypothetical protein
VRSGFTRCLTPSGNLPDMGCACKDKKALTPDSRHLTRAYPGVEETGITLLATAPDCTTPYNGVFRQATVFIVGWNTKDEQLFKRGDRTKALEVARTNKLTFDQVPARSLCHESMVALLGS